MGDLGPRYEARLLAEVRRDLDALEPVVTGGRMGKHEAVSVGRIGGPAAARRLTATLDGENWEEVVVATALLEPTQTTRNAPPEPRGPWAVMERSLWGRYAVTEDIQTAESLVFALARVGGMRSMMWLTVDLDPLPIAHTPQRAASALRAIALLCARGFSLPDGGGVVIESGLRSVHGIVRSAAAYALTRCLATSGELFAEEAVHSRVRDRVVGLLSGPEPDEVRTAWKALAKLGDLPMTIPSGILGPVPPPWRVEVEAVRAMAGDEEGRAELYRRLETFGLSGLDGPRAHVLLVALRGLRADTSGRLDTLMAAVASAWPLAKGRRRRALAWARCELLFRRAFEERTPQMLESCATDPEVSALHVAKLVVDASLAIGRATKGKRGLDTLLALAADARPAVAAFALATLAEVDDARANPTLRAALEGVDVGRIAAAAGAVAARSKDAAKRDENAAEVLVRLIPRLVDPGSVEAKVAVVDALADLITPSGVDGGMPRNVGVEAEHVVELLGGLAVDPVHAVRVAARRALLFDAPATTRFDLRAQQRPAAAFPAVDVSEVLASNARGLKVHTTAGSFSISFAGAQAPINQANLVRLATGGAFAGTPWHRVVPGFVTQGGDPRGDGYGGPGYLVPCEWSNLKYVRGTVGMAHAGKDTAGSQFFIAHTAQPHLDGRYTVVGFVDDGMDVVDSLLVGDRIERVEVATAP